MAELPTIVDLTNEDLQAAMRTNAYILRVVAHTMPPDATRDDVAACLRAMAADFEGMAPGAAEYYQEARRRACSPDYLRQASKGIVVVTDGEFRLATERQGLGGARWRKARRR